jgi:hypothetical protein
MHAHCTALHCLRSLDCSSSLLIPVLKADALKAGDEEMHVKQLRALGAR